MDDTGADQEDSGVFETLSAQECAEMLTTTTVGRIGFASANGQQILPVNFVFRDGSVLFRTTPHGVAAALLAGADDVAFEVDYHDDLYQLGWSVLLVGRTERVTDPETVAELSTRRRPNPWAAGERPAFVRLVPHVISGRRVAGH